MQRRSCRGRCIEFCFLGACPASLVQDLLQAGVHYNYCFMTASWPAMIPVTTLSRY